MRLTADLIAARYDNAEWCARAAGLTYTDPEEPGLRRVGAGRGFSYRGVNGAVVSAAVRERITLLVIPPAWRDVWICPDPDGHIQALGTDDRGRRQYLYHPKWRGLRDLLNFYRLVGFGEALPTVRADVEAQLRRRTLDRELVIATMLRIVDRCGLRAGSEVYAEENDSFGLTTLRRRHAVVNGSTTTLTFPAKSGQRAFVTLDDAAVARVVKKLTSSNGPRLFALSRATIDADDLNERLGELCGSRITLKDFRTWRGTETAFTHLRANLDSDNREDEVLQAVDAAAEALGNTRAVARAHYVHPHLLEAYLDGDLKRLLKRSRSRASRNLSAQENSLLGFLRHSLRRWDGRIAS